MQRAAAAPSVHQWLVELGLEKYSDGLSSFGVESMRDLLDVEGEDLEEVHRFHPCFLSIPVVIFRKVCFHLC